MHRLPHFHDFKLRQCLFGLHLLRPETKTVAVVEAEKTAVVASMFFPDLNNSIISHWLSNNATDEMRRKGLDIADILEKMNPETKLSITDFI